MFETTQQIDIAAPVERVYDYLADFPRHQEWSLSVAELEQTSGTGTVVGAEFKASETLPGKFVSYSRITSLERPRHIAWQSWDGRTFHVNWSFDLSPSVGGGTRLIQRSQVTPDGLFGRIMLALMRKRQMPKENRQSMERIKELIESGKAIEPPTSATARAS
jgi:uncharacterized membrane protein